MDRSGRVSARGPVEALGWRAGDQLQFASVSGSVLAHRDPDGVFAMATKPYVVLPAAVRKRCGLRAGDQVLIAADPNHDVLVVHPLAALDSMVVAYHTALVDGGDGHGCAAG